MILSNNHFLYPHPKALSKVFVEKWRNSAWEQCLGVEAAIINDVVQVLYGARGFLDKNRDSLPDGAVELMRTSALSLVQIIFLGQSMFV